MRCAILPIFLLPLAILGCAEEQPRPAEAEVPVSQPADRPPPSDADAPKVVFLGDSLTAGYALPEEEALPAATAAELAERGLEIRAINAGISGDTSAGGLSRLDWSLAQEPDLLVLELGVNDALRGIPLEETEENLRQIVLRAQGAGVPVLLVGMRVFPNYGEEYGQRFAQLYPRLAEELELPLVPFLLEGIAGRPELNLADGIHPNAEGCRRMGEIVAPWVERALAGNG